jgi:hypothetical protein
MNTQNKCVLQPCRWSYMQTILFSCVMSNFESDWRSMPPPPFCVCVFGNVVVDDQDSHTNHA